jgi:anti-anti-sigma factor
MASEMGVVVLDDPANGRLILYLSGAVNAGSARLLRDTARTCADAGAGVVVDCSQAESLDAAGLQVIIALSRKLRAKNLKLHLSQPSDAVRAVLRMVALGDEFQMDGEP